MLATACRDSSVAPSVPARTATVNRPVLDKLIGSTSFDYTPGEGIYANVGGQNTIYIPANAICQQGVSGYGAGTWDDACAPSTKVITITAKSWLDDQGSPLRRVPSRAALRAEQVGHSLHRRQQGGSGRHGPHHLLPRRSPAGSTKRRPTRACSRSTGRAASIADQATSAATTLPRREDTQGRTFGW